MTPALAPGALAGVTLSVLRLEDDSDIHLSAAEATLSPDERDRAARLCFPRDRDRFIRGRGHLRRELARETGQKDPAALRFDTGPQGKPRLRLPSAPHFNLSHSGGLAVLAISRRGPVGIDLERIDRGLDPARLAPSVLTPDERQALDAAPPEDAVALFLAFWTAKEARMKLTGEGMALDPRHIALALRQGGRPKGYRLPADPPARLDYLDIGHPGAICALARLPGPAEGAAA